VASKRNWLAVALVFLAGAAAWAYEPSLFNLTVPSALWKGNLDLLILHRFYGSVLDQPLENLFGLAGGANVGFGARLMVVPGLQLRALYATGLREIAAGAGYARWFPAAHLGLQADAQYLSREAAAVRVGSLFSTLTAQSTPILKRVRLSGEVGYDSRLNHLGFGTGLAVELLPVLSLVAEFYPYLPQGWERHTAELGDTHAFAFGIMAKTAGHQFSLLAGNSSDVGEAHLMAGAPADGGLYLGFNIQRLFTLY
jgi:hypothetical protein